jgi:hypothetical protein
MKKAVCAALVLASTLFLMSSAAIAAECSGSWSYLPNYSPGAGGPCAIIGLNTHQAVCQPGQRYATYCDDASGGRYRTCQSNIPCSRDPQRGYAYDDSSRYDSGRDRDHRRDYRDGQRDDRRDYRRDRYEDRGDYRDNRRDGYQDRSRDCTNWDYNTNRPCAPGTINRDCLKGCDGRLY